MFSDLLNITQQLSGRSQVIHGFFIWWFLFTVCAPTLFFFVIKWEVFYNKSNIMEYRVHMEGRINRIMKKDTVSKSILFVIFLDEKEVKYNMRCHSYCDSGSLSWLSKFQSCIGFWPYSCLQNPEILWKREALT